MQLPLADADLAAFAFAVLRLELLDVGFEFVEMVHAVVGDADGADPAGVLGFDQSAPGAEAALFAAVGGVDEVSRIGRQFPELALGSRNEGTMEGDGLQVYVIESGLAEAGVDG